jgi:hypothetical protein
LHHRFFILAILQTIHRIVLKRINMQNKEQRLTFLDGRSKVGRPGPRVKRNKQATTTRSSAATRDTLFLLPVDCESLERWPFDLLTEKTVSSWKLRDERVLSRPAILRRSHSQLQNPDADLRFEGQEGHAKNSLSLLSMRIDTISNS